MSGKGSVSILITHYQGVQILRDCLASLKPVAGPQVEVVLVDNGSQDDVPRILADFPFVKGVRLDQTRYFTGGNNFGLQHCSGDYVLLLNNDTVVNASFVSTLSRYLDEHAQVGLVQGKMVLPKYHGTLDVCGSFLTRLGFPYHYGYFKPDGPQYQRAYPVFCGKGACLMFRREMVPQIGGFLFDEDFVCYYEETDLCHRAWLAGYETHFVPSAPIEHLMGATNDLNPEPAFTLRRYLRNMMFSLLSNLSPGSLLRIMPFFLSMLLCSTLLSALTLKKAQFLAHWEAFSYCLRNVKKIRARRALMRQIRKQSDAAIFAKVLRTPRWDYFLKTFQGRLREYEDEPLR